MRERYQNGCETCWAVFHARWGHGHPCDPHLHGACASLYAGLRSLPLPSPWLGRLWRAADVVRKYRGDSHITAWVAAGLDPVEAV